jgi:hypothetical protein
MRGCEVHVTGSGSCQMAGSGNSGYFLQGLSRSEGRTRLEGV